MKAALLLLVPLLALATPALAQDKQDLRFRQCMIDASASGRISEVHACLGPEQQRKDAEMKRDYNLLWNDLAGKPRQAELEEVQRRWIQYKNANCNFYDDPESGANASLEVALCVLESTKARIKELERFI